jgi:hypothetical protein
MRSGSEAFPRGNQCELCSGSELQGQQEAVRLSSVSTGLKSNTDLPQVHERNRQDATPQMEGRRCRPRQRSPGRVPHA